MSLNTIGVHVVGPGSQPVEQDQMSYIDMPGDMQTFSPTRLDDPRALLELPDAREAMLWLREALAAYATDSGPRLADLTDLDPQSRDTVNQILGEGEVGVTVSTSFDAHCQEAVLAGVWRTVVFDADGNIGRDLLEVADAPTVIGCAAESTRAVDTSPPENAADVPNALPILVELSAASTEFERNGTRHSINLSLLPLSDEEIEFIDTRIGRGPVDILSRAYGKCQVISTQTANVWWVRYYNSMGTPVLNTLEVVDVPEVVKAASEDLSDSRQRLEEILAPYWSDVA